MIYTFSIRRKKRDRLVAAYVPVEDGIKRLRDGEVGPDGQMPEFPYYPSQKYFSGRTTTSSHGSGGRQRRVEDRSEGPCFFHVEVKDIGFFPTRQIKADCVAVCGAADWAVIVAYRMDLCLIRRPVHRRKGDVHQMLWHKVNDLSCEICLAPPPFQGLCDSHGNPLRGIKAPPWL